MDICDFSKKIAENLASNERKSWWTLEPDKGGDERRSWTLEPDKGGAPAAERD